MLIGLTIRDVVLIEALDLEVGPGLTVLTGETGAGKSIVLDALGLALGRRADAGLVRRGAVQALTAALFDPTPSHPVWAALEDKGFAADPGEPVSLRRQVSSDGRSRAFINDQPASAGALKEIGALLVEVHGQHETVGLLDQRTHRALLDAASEAQAPARAAADAYRAFAAASRESKALEETLEGAVRAADERGARLQELERLAPQPGEEARLHEERVILGAAEKTLVDIAAARDALSGDQLRQKLSGAFRALERARDRTLQAGVDPEGPVALRLAAAAEAIDRALAEADEALVAVDAAAEVFEFDAERLERTEERLFALRAAARKLGAAVDDLPEAQKALAAEMEGFAALKTASAAAAAKAAETKAAFQKAAMRLRAARGEAAERLTEAVMRELAPLKLEKARFRVEIAPLEEDRAGPYGLDRVEFQISTNPGAPFGPLGAIASGGELARLALALKAALARSDGSEGPTMIFDEVDQGVGGAVAAAVGERLKALASGAQVILVTHSPQVAARGDVHWKVAKAAVGDGTSTAITVLGASEREEELARMLAGAQVTPAARAAARALLKA